MNFRDKMLSIIDEVLEENAREKFLCRNDIARLLSQIEEVRDIVRYQIEIKGKKNDPEWLIGNWVDQWSAYYTRDLPHMEKYIRKYERKLGDGPSCRKRCWCYKLRKGYSEQ